MPKRNLPEFYYDSKKQQYRKRITLPDGRKKDLYAKDKETLRKRVAALRQDIEENQYHAENPTLAEYAIEWCARRLPGLSESRKNDYRNAINNHILPGLGGNRLLREISSADVDLFMASRAGVSNSLHGKIVSTLKQLFSSAVRDGLLRSSPAEHVKSGGRPAEEKVPLTTRQQEGLIQAVSGTPALTFVLLALRAGLRKEEILGLEWDCVHLSGLAPYLEVERVCTFQGNRAVVHSKLKTKAARRKIPLPPQLHEHLLSWRIQNPYDFVVPNSQGGPRSSQSFRRLWEIVENRTAGTCHRWSREHRHNIPVTRALGEKTTNHAIVCSLDFHCTPHQLRHTYITGLCASGKLDIKKIQYLAGHATVQMTLNIYSHVVDNRPEELLAGISAAFAPRPQMGQAVPPGSTP